MKQLIVAPAWVGDMIMAHTLVRQLRSVNADAEIHMLAPPATYPLAMRMPGVSGAIEFPLAHGELGWSKRKAIAQDVQQQQFDQAFILPNSLKSALVPYLAKIPKRTGWHGESRFVLLNDRRRLDKDALPLMIERFMALASTEAALARGPMPKPYPLPQLQADPDNASALTAAHQLHSDGAIALCPGAEFGPAKQWPAAHYAAVAQVALAQQRQVWLLGSPKDALVCAEIEQLLSATSVDTSGLRNLAGKTKLLDAVDVLSQASAVVCNDSGLMHVACALGRPVVALFGSTSPDFTPPLGDGAQVLQHSVPCSPCFQRTCPLEHMDCLQQLNPQRVLVALQLAPA